MARLPSGVRRHGAGYQIHGSVRGVRFCEQFPRSASMAEIVERRRVLVRGLEGRVAKVARGTLAADVRQYLDTLVDRPRLRHARAKHLSWWVARFGHRRRYSLRRDELLAALAELAHEPGRGGRAYAVSTRKKYRTALFHLYTTLDGKDAPNPLRDIPPPTEPDAEPRWIPYEIIDALFDAMDDSRTRGRLTAAMVIGIRTQLAQGVGPSAIARDLEISETMVRKIRDGQWSGRRDAPSKTKARLIVMAFTGITPAQLARLEPATDIDWHAPSVLVRGRLKGQGGGRTTRVPLTPEGATALRRLVDAKATGPFSTSSAAKLFRRAIDRMVGDLARTDWRTAKIVYERLHAMRARPYDLRHSYLTEAQQAGGDIRSTQMMATHADIRQTMRYTLASVDPRLKSVADQLAARLAGRVTLSTSRRSS